jgi:hypothetical protein
MNICFIFAELAMNLLELCCSASHFQCTFESEVRPVNGAAGVPSTGSAVQ